jgi:PBP1b-binding outer membrane lipoprotein LpoB
MPEILIVKDVVRNTPFAIVVKSDDSLSFYGFHEMGAEWAKSANSNFSKESEIITPEWTEATTFKKVSENVANSIIEKTESNKIETAILSEEVISKTLKNDTVFSGRTVFSRSKIIETKSEKTDIDARPVSKINRIGYRAKSFKNSLKNTSLIIEAKNKKIGIDPKSGLFIDSRAKYGKSFDSESIQKKAGFGASRRISRFMDEKAEFGCKTNRSLRRVKSISDRAESDSATRIGKALEQKFKRF